MDNDFPTRPERLALWFIAIVVFGGLALMGTMPLWVHLVSPYE